MSLIWKELRMVFIVFCIGVVVGVFIGCTMAVMAGVFW